MPTSYVVCRATRASAACAWNGTISGGAFPSKQTRDDQSELEPARERICRDISAPRTSDCGGIKMMIYRRRNVGRLVNFSHVASGMQQLSQKIRTCTRYDQCKWNIPPLLHLSGNCSLTTVHVHGVHFSYGSNRPTAWP
jgi:hypothetical protein